MSYPAVKFPRPPVMGGGPVKLTLGYLRVKNKHASQPEFFTAKALDYWGLDYLFQVDYFGGRRTRGGFVVDFLVFTKPRPTPVWINGEWFHKGQQLTLDYLQQIILQSFQDVNPAIIFWAKDVASFDLAKVKVRQTLV
jgi:hypothetical protein